MDLELSKIITDNDVKERMREISGKSIYLYGAGSFGKETCYFLKENGIEICGFLDIRADEIKEYCGKPVYSLTDPVLKAEKEEALILFSIVMDKDRRKMVMEEIKGAGFHHIEEAQFYRSIQIVPDDLDTDEGPADYYIRRRNGIQKAYGLLEDEKSRAVYIANIKAHFLKDYSGCAQWEEAMGEQYFPPDLIPASRYSRFVDCGGFTGDTVKALLDKIGNIKEIVVFEPDMENFKKLAAYCRESRREEIICFPCAVADRTDFLHFSAARGSGSISENGASTVLGISLDEALACFAPTFIKMDIEGAEVRALRGAKRLICEHVPDLAVCVYHHTNHLWDVMLLLKSWDLGYQFYLRSYNAYTMETVLYAVKGEN